MKKLLIALILLAVASTTFSAPLSERLQSSFNEKKDVAIKKAASAAPIVKNNNPYQEIFLKHRPEIDKDLAAIKKEVDFLIGLNMCTELETDCIGIHTFSEVVKYMILSRYRADFQGAVDSYDFYLGSVEYGIAHELINMEGLVTINNKSEIYGSLSRLLALGEKIKIWNKDLRSKSENSFNADVKALLDYTKFPKEKYKNDLYKIYASEHGKDVYKMAWSIRGYCGSSSVAEDKEFFSDFYGKINNMQEQYYQSDKLPIPVH
ncbi:hypothetical protein AAIR98_001011 [Elusimicrobium simillimum]|uniref:hypothetical protein n=1 Tax=Elusimicrobium simillimum TaxID=3143438 RepID=UPI003C6FA74E